MCGRRIGGPAMIRPAGSVVISLAAIFSAVCGGTAQPVREHVLGPESARAPLVLTDGSLLLNGPGGRSDNMGYLLHRYDRSTRSWSSHYPALRDSTFNVAVDRRWQRHLASTPDGKVLSFPRTIGSRSSTPTGDFQVETRIRRTPESWPADIAIDYERRRREDPLSRPFGERCLGRLEQSFVGSGGHRTRAFRRRRIKHRLRERGARDRVAAGYTVSGA
jgi:hypothetical protein